jgi:hypothetical protein
MMAEHKVYTVSELIAKLATFPQDAKVYINYEDFAYSGIQGIEFNDEKHEIDIMIECALYEEKDHA